MTKKLEGKVAIVTGASKGIGSSIAKHLAEEGAKVVVNYATSKEGADRVVKEIKSHGGEAIAIQANMSKPPEIKTLFKEAQKAFGKVDILVNNAGIYEFAPIEELTPEQFYKMFDLNVLGVLFAMQEAAKYFGKKGGSIVNISSIASVKGMPNTSIYSATKAAVDSFTKSLANELGKRHIRVNAVNPGLIETEGTISQDLATEGDFRKEVEHNTPLNRIGHPEDVAPAVAFLASDEADFITGETLVIAGGFR